MRSRVAWSLEKPSMPSRSLSAGGRELAYAGRERGESRHTSRACRPTHPQPSGRCCGVHPRPPCHPVQSAAAPPRSRPCAPVRRAQAVRRRARGGAWSPPPPPPSCSHARPQLVGQGLSAALQLLKQRRLCRKKGGRGQLAQPARPPVPPPFPPFLTLMVMLSQPASSQISPLLRKEAAGGGGGGGT